MTELFLANGFGSDLVFADGIFVISQNDRLASFLVTTQEAEALSSALSAWVESVTA